MEQEEKRLKVCDIQKYNELKEVDKQYVKRALSIGISAIGIVIWLSLEYKANLPILKIPAIINSSIAGFLVRDLIDVVAEKIGLEKEINETMVELEEKGKNR